MVPVVRTGMDYGLDWARRFRTRTTASPRAEVSSFRVAVLGAGNGGLALAGYLSRHGHAVALWNRSPQRIAAVHALGGVQLTLPGAATVYARTELVTCRMAAALADARHILITVPASAHADLARGCAPYLRNGQTVLLLPGRTGGALEFRRVLRQSGCRAEILLGETNTFPLAARAVGPSEAVVFGTKADVGAAALPATRTDELVAAWRPVLPMLSAAGSVLHTGLANLGAILHPVITLSNAGRIRRGDSFDFYTEGVTAPVAALLAAADAERLQVARAYGVVTDSLRDWIAAAYGHRASSILEAVAGNPAYVGIKAPETLRHRYLLEDVPTGLIPLIEFGRAAGLAVPTLRGLVARARGVLGGAAWPRARTLAALGLSGIDPASIRALVAHGPARIARAG